MSFRKDVVGGLSESPITIAANGSNRLERQDKNSCSRETKRLPFT
jgi:hypothetical protein